MIVKKKVPVKNKTSVLVNAGKDEDQDEAVAKKLTRPEVQASLAIHKLQPINDVNGLTKILSQQTGEVIGKMRGLMFAGCTDLDNKPTYYY